MRLYVSLCLCACLSVCVCVCVVQLQVCCGLLPSCKLASDKTALTEFA